MAVVCLAAGVGRANSSAVEVKGGDVAPSGRWYYKPYEYEAWMLQRMRTEADRGILHFGYPGKFLTLKDEPKAVWSEKPIAGLE